MYNTQKNPEMPNYQNGKIYSIRSRSRPDLIYIGSTIRPLSERLAGHRHKAKYMCSRQIIDIGDAYIELIENFSCSNVEELRRREGHFQRSMTCINQLIAGRTIQEWRQDNKEEITKNQKKYWQQNKEILSIQSRKYREQNKEQLLSWNKTYRLDNKEEIKKKRDAQTNTCNKRVCICGTLYNYGYTSDRNKHYRSQKHQDHIQLIYEKLGLT